MSVSGVSSYHNPFPVAPSYTQANAKPVVLNLVEVNNQVLSYSEDEAFVLKEDRYGATKVKKELEPIGTVGVGPCIAIIAYGISSTGKRVNGIFHWSGPDPDEDPSVSAINALEKLMLSMQDCKVPRSGVQLICMGGQEMSMKNQQTLNTLKNEYQIVSDVINFPYESETGWDIVVDGDTVYYGVDIIKREY